MKYFFLFIVLVLYVSLAKAQQAYETITNISYYEDTTGSSDQYKQGKCQLDFYYPKDKKDFATIIWFHAGGLITGKKEIPVELMEKGCAVIGVGYRFYPFVKAPAYIEDAAAAEAWVFKHIADYGGNPRLIFVSGHSAGGYLTLMTGLDKH
ncbi:hypothetical protein BZG01_12715 [Labilibaculum manganireducens]|uniref:BD-FAE-like domain-containing protein n=1 Tax=Labilibaculum manganireducens TaxID=1940525 RepID=A0A2N3I702_9BACT|nr:alpha/beta hydrolase [Labilibaculum manganireducens]PKQ66013.1 hypothetical protein BZG01_12715 [Labilibaculum manganireducens]